MTEERLALLVESFLEGTLTAEERAELEALVRSDTVLRERFLGHVRLHVRLHGECARVDEAKAVELILSVDSDARRVKVWRAVEARLRERRSPASFSAWPWVAAAAGVLLVALAVALAGPRPSPEKPPAARAAEPPVGEPPPEPRVAEETTPSRSAAGERPLPPRRPEAAAPAEAELPKKAEEGLPPKPAAAPGAEPPRPPEAAPKVAPPPSPSRPESRAAIATLEPGRDILEGERIETTYEPGILRFPDGTRMELAPGTLVRRVTVERGKRVEMERGGVAAEVARQPAGQPMVFVTPQAEAAVLGTTLRLAVDGKGTRLEVLEGRVRLTRLSDRKSVDVAAGFFAVAAAGSDFAASRIVDEVFLAPAQGRIRGSEWRLVRDPLAFGGQALEARGVKTAPPGQMDLRNRLADFVEFAFIAEANKDYHVWVRGAATAAADKTRHDAVGLEVPTGRFVRPSSWPEVAAFGGHEFNGWGHRAGWWWIGGDADPDTPADRSDAVPALVRFSRHGVQVLRLFAIESPLRIDAIWLSTTQKTRPEPERRGPGR